MYFFIKFQIKICCKILNRHLNNYIKWWFNIFLIELPSVYLQQFHGHIFCTFAFCSRKAETLFIYTYVVIAGPTDASSPFTLLQSMPTGIWDLQNGNWLWLLMQYVIVTLLKAILSNCYIYWWCVFYNSMRATLNALFISLSVFVNYHGYRSSSHVDGIE